MKKILIFTLLLFFAGCGFKPVYKNDIKTKQFSLISLEGDKFINSKIVALLQVKENDLDKSLKKLKLNSSFTHKEILKDKRGQTSLIRSSIIIELFIYKDKNLLESKKFIESTTYSNITIKSELSDYQNRVRDNLLIKIVQNINLYLNVSDS